MATETKTILALLEEKRSLPPHKKFREKALVKSDSIYDIFTLSVLSSTIYGSTTVTNQNLAINITDEIEFN